MGRARGSGIELDSSFQKAGRHDDPNGLLLSDHTVVAFIVSCPPDWIGSKYSCYWIRKEHMKWKEALHFCESAATGAHLLDINTEEEHIPPVLLYAVNIRSNLPRRPVQDRISSKGLCELELEMNKSYLPIIPLPQNTKSTIFPVQHHTIS
uniref:C-type lectin domain-containing protein n=1 Tax=Callorhinchus milii TaxID=7868 RepID=A0A4W3I7W2_CALMI